MNTYVIRRRSNWADAEELSAAAALSKQVGGEMADQIRWIRTYVLDEDDGRLGSICVYQAVSADAVKEHAKRASLRADEITQVADTVVVREDPTAQQV